MESSVLTIPGQIAGVRIKTPITDARTPTHFIVLLDASDSMNINGKLEHVKFCTSLLLKLMTPADQISLITFGDESRIILTAVPTDAIHLSSIQESVSTLETDGCTNLSAGLASVHTVLAASKLKPMLLILTDGNANRGITTTSTLKEIVGRLYEQWAVALSVIGYGTDHNAALLKAFAEDSHGSYSIVDSVEGAALAMGDALGGAMSCVAQNVEIACPPDTTVFGPYTCIGGRCKIGDLYAGSESLFLFKGVNGPVTVTGTLVPSMEPFRLVAEASSADRNAEIELTALRYTCSGLFRRVRSWNNLMDRDSLLADIAAFRQEIEDPYFAGNAITDMLISELASLDEALHKMRNHLDINEVTARILQHEAYTSLGRGTTRPIQETAHGDPCATVQSPLTSRIRRETAMLLRTMSQEPV